MPRGRLCQAWGAFWRQDHSARREAGRQFLAAGGKHGRRFARGESCIRGGCVTRMQRPRILTLRHAFCVQLTKVFAAQVFQMSGVANMAAKSNVTDVRFHGAVAWFDGRRSRPTLGLWLLFFMLVPRAWAIAPAWEPPERIRAVAERFIREHEPAAAQAARIEVQAPAAEIRFPRCADLQAGFFGQANPFGSMTVVVRCTAPQAWTVYLPARVAMEQRVVVAARPLEAGKILAAADLTLVQHNTGQLAANAVLAPQAIVGKVLRYNVAAGQPLLENMLLQPEVIRYGQAVTLVALGEGVRLTALGSAMENGRTGQSILVRNIQSGKLVRGTVDAAGQVVVPTN